MAVLHENYINEIGKKYKGVKELAFTKDNIFGNVGKFISETEYEHSDYFVSEEESGVYIYQDFNKSNIAYRIYKEFADYNFNGYKDDVLISKLQKRQSNIHLTKAPFGVVTLDGKIIGQIIYFFENYITLYEFSMEKSREINYIKLYIKMLTILKELYDNGILYLDIHAKNFMINSHNKINLIDFEHANVVFDDFSKHHIERFFQSFNNMIQILNKNLGIEELFENYIRTNNFDDTFYQLDTLSKKLVNK